MFKKTIFLFFLLAFSGQVFSQFARKHWFAIPHFTADHADRPVYIIIRASDYKGQYTISLPSRNQQLFSGNIEPRQTIILDFSPYVNITKPLPFNAIHKTGLLIESNVPIAAFFEVMGDSPGNAGPADNT
ncbi:MAG: hypothetical protein SNJ77_07170, partial [Cytophagales bacterium]